MTVNIRGSCTKQIVVCDMSTYKAFFDESGLGDSANAVDCAWAKNEEMVDWFALQGPKIWKAWQEANAI